jgi:hypothetical protein
MQRFLLLLVAAAALLLSPVRVHANLPHLITISGTGAVVRVSATDIQASSIQFTAPAANSGIARIGDATVTSAIGEALPAGTGQYFPPRWQGSYSLNGFYVYVASGDTATILWTDLN